MSPIPSIPFVRNIYVIIHETTPPYSSKSNRVAKRKNRTLKESMSAMLVSSRASLNF